MTNECNCNNCPIGCSVDSGTSSNQGTAVGSEPKLTAGAQHLAKDAYATARENPVGESIPGTVIMDVLASIQSVVPDVMNSVSDVAGYLCRIWYPFGSSSVYGKNSNRIRYSAEPQVQKCFMGANLFVQANMGVFDGSEFAPYIGETPYLMTFNYRIPENSKVQIFYGNSSRWMKVRRHEGIDGANTYLMILNFLSPCNSQGIEIHDDPLPTEESSIVVDPVNAEGTVKAGQNLI